ncbi:hypothetical protein RHSIM_Rhsim10G0119700 [Rhododendron simsii]|uniref:CCHC-type domain-containing protein n=1 Tax=Rhododendron simsii TaxID=118357 RepID=A0A834LDK6_RHOSS|nr:hypothetical protein RHSIM_Rhsim10G0119700 [Rhododendron simsii]
MVVPKSLGDVITVKDPGDCGRMTNFLRVRVWLDVSKPLKKGFLLRRSKEEDLWVHFKYERLSDFCYGCGKVSHTTNECMEKHSFNAKDWEFDGSLRAEFMVRTNSLESDTSQAGINEVEDLSSGTPSVVQQINFGSIWLKCGFGGPSIGLSSGGEAVCDGPLYFVEEPDSPRPKSSAGRAKNLDEIQVGPISFLGNSLSVDLGKVGQYPRTGEEGLVSAFNKTLNLKRKGVEESERDQGKRLKGSDSTEVGEQELSLVRLSTGGKGSTLSPHRGCLGRGRGRRGGRAGRSSIRGWNQILALCDADLVDVEVRVGGDSGEPASEGIFGSESALVGATV